MNDVPPSQPSDDIDSFYRRASALDPSRPSDRTRQAVLAHAREVAASNTRVTTRLRRRERWWRPAVFGTLAAAALAGLLVLPQILTPHVAPRTTQATAQLSEPAKSARATAPVPAPPPPAFAPVTAPPPPAAKPTRERDTTDRRRSAQEPATARASAGVSGGAEARDQPAPSESESITVTGQRVAPRALESPSPASAIASPELAREADTAAANEALKAQVGSPQGLRLAAETGDLKRLQRFVDQLTDVNSRDDAGRTALLLAVLHGQTKAVEFLLAHGANPNTADAEGVTPLSAAMAGNHSAIIRMLKHAGAH